MGRPLVMLRRYSGIWSSDCGRSVGKQQNGLALRCLSGTGMVSAMSAELAHVLHHALHIFDRRAGNDAVAEIEDVSGAAAGLLQDLAHALAKQILARRTAVMGSRLPCTATAWPRADQPWSKGTRQSRPITSAPVSRMAGSRVAVSTPK